MSHYFRLINKLCILSLLISIFPSGAQEKFQGELTFSSIGLNSGENVLVTITASGNKTRWFSTQPEDQHPYLPTSNYGSLSGQGQGDNFWALNAPDNSGPISISWGYYTIDVSVSSQKIFSTFQLDLRDANWTNGGYRQENCQDTEIVYSTTEPKLFHRNKASGGNYGVIESGSIHKIWDWYGINQNKTDLLVPVTANNNFATGQIKMNGTNYDTPKTLNWSWTTQNSISVITPQLMEDGHKYVFRKWSDGITSQSRSLTIDDQHNSYSFTANFWWVDMTGPGTLNEYQVGTFTASPVNGTPPYNFTWYKMQLCASTEEKSGAEPDALHVMSGFNYRSLMV